MGFERLRRDVTAAFLMMTVVVVPALAYFSQATLALDAALFAGPVLAAVAVAAGWTALVYRRFVGPAARAAQGTPEHAAALRRMCRLPGALGVTTLLQWAVLGTAAFIPNLVAGHLTAFELLCVEPLLLSGGTTAWLLLSLASRRSLARTLADVDSRALPAHDGRCLVFRLSGAMLAMVAAPLATVLSATLLVYFRGGDILAYRLGMGLVVAESLASAALVGWLLSTSLTESLAVVVRGMRHLAMGQVRQRVPITRDDEVGAMQRELNELAAYLEEHVAGNLHRLARGDLSVQPSTRGTADELGPSMQQAARVLRQLVEEVEGFVAAARDGQLGARRDATRFEGTYRALLDGFNAALDALAAPISDAAHVLDRVARGDLTVRMRSGHRGDFARIETSLNHALARLHD
jgi:HAMP domain-containing protein